MSGFRAGGHSPTPCPEPRRFRDAEGWGQEKFAFEANIYRTQVSNIERGSRNTTIMVLKELAKPLGVTASELLEG